jgi:hypothetical protein
VLIYILELLCLQISLANFEFTLEFHKNDFVLLEVPLHQNFLHGVGSSNKFSCYEEYFRFFRYTYSPPPPLGITKILSHPPAMRIWLSVSGAAGGVDAEVPVPAVPASSRGSRTPERWDLASARAEAKHAQLEAQSLREALASAHSEADSAREEADVTKKEAVEVERMLTP